MVAHGTSINTSFLAAWYWYVLYLLYRYVNVIIDINIYIYVNIYIYIFIYLFIYIYIYISLSLFESTQLVVCLQDFRPFGRFSVKEGPEDLHFSPHHCLGFLFLVVHFRPPPASRPPPAPLTHTQLTHTHTHTHTTHTPLTHTHTTYTHTQLAPTLTLTLTLALALTLTLTLTHLHTPTHTHTPLTHHLRTHTQFTHTQLTHTQLTHTHTTYSHTQHGTWWHRPSFCVAGLALGDIDRHFAWQARQLWHWAGSGDALRSPWSPRHFAYSLRGTRGTWRHRPSFCAAGVALGDINHHFAWQAWHWPSLCVAAEALWHWAGSGECRWTLWSPRHFAWQAWHLATSTFRGRRGTLRGRRGTWRHRPSFCVAGVAVIALAWLWWHAWVSVDAEKRTKKMYTCVFFHFFLPR